MAKFALALHGGAGASRRFAYDREIEDMRGLVERARDRLQRGDMAIDVAQDVVAQMEASGLYVAGKGGSPNKAGDYELEACIMDGRTRRAGAVAALCGFQSPIAIARLVMRRTQHVLLVGEGAQRFADEHGAERIPSDEPWFTHAAEGESNHPPDFLPTGTVGCVVLDSSGNLAAATSSAGVFGKMPGRLADSALPGSGTWADDQVAVSCTGQGELFIQGAAAAQLAFRIRSGEALEEGAAATLADITRSGGEGGIVAVDREGNISCPFNAEGMKRAFLTPDGQIHVAIF